MSVVSFHVMNDEQYKGYWIRGLKPVGEVGSTSPNSTLHYRVDRPNNTRMAETFISMCMAKKAIEAELASPTKPAP